MLLTESYGEASGLLSGLESAVPLKVQEIQKVIAAALDSVKKGSLKIPFQVDRSHGAILALKHLGCENSFKQLKGDLIAFTQEHLHDPALQVISLYLLNKLAHPDSPMAEEAKKILATFHGQAGSFKEMASSAIKNFTYAENHVPLMSAVALAGLGGRLVKVALSSVFRQGGMFAGRSLLGHSLSGSSAILAESAIFPLGQQAGLSLLGGQASFQNFGEQFMQGLKFMTTLGATGFVARRGVQFLHQVNSLGHVTRFHQAARWTQPLAPVLSEYIGLVSLNRIDQPGSLWTYSLLHGVKTMLDLRFARSLNKSLMPGLERAYHTLDHRAYRAMQQSVTDISNKIFRMFPKNNSSSGEWVAQGIGQISTKELQTGNLVRDLGLDHAQMGKGRKNKRRGKSGKSRNQPIRSQRSSPAEIEAKNLSPLTPKALAEGMVRLAKRLADPTRDETSKNLWEKNADVFMATYFSFQQNRKRVGQFVTNLRKVIQKESKNLSFDGQIALSEQAIRHLMSLLPINPRPIVNFCLNGLKYLINFNNWTEDNVQANMVLFRTINEFSLACMIQFASTEKQLGVSDKLLSGVGKKLFPEVLEAATKLFFEGPEEVVLSMASMSSNPPDLLMGIIMRNHKKGASDSFSAELRFDPGSRHLNRILLYYHSLEGSRREYFMGRLQEYGSTPECGKYSLGLRQYLLNLRSN